MDSGKSAATKSTEKRHLNNQKTQEYWEELMEFIRELISERWIKVRVERSISQSKQKDLKISQGVLSKTLFLMAINGILGELGNGED